MDTTQLRYDLSIRAKNGIAFLLSAAVIWFIITGIFLQSFSLQGKNIFMLFSTGLLFPLALLISRITKADWKLENNPLNRLGLYLNLAQLMYFPIVFWAFIHSPSNMVMLFAIITGAHFFPYGWFYHTKAYYIMAPVISVTMMIVGTTVNETGLWMIPLAMAIFLLILSLWLYLDYKKKAAQSTYTWHESS